MTDMIEKLARGMLAAFYDGEKAAPSETWTDSEDRADLSAFTVDGDIDLRGLARAALEALRTPTNEMIEAGVNRGRRDDLYTDVEHCFQVMVDKALGRVDLPVGEEQQA